MKKNIGGTGFPACALQNFSKQNEVDISDLEDDVKEGLQIVLADSLELLVDVVLVKQ